MAEIYFDDVIMVDRIDPDGKKYDKVSRIEARSEEYNMEMQVDLNTEIYPVRVGERFRMAITPSLHLDGKAVASDEGAPKSLADKFEYVAHGLLYKMSEDMSGSTAKVVVYVSFGGLQLMLKGDPSHVGKLKIDQRLFLLLRKV